MEKSTSILEKIKNLLMSKEDVVEEVVETELATEPVVEPEVVLEVTEEPVAEEVVEETKLTIEEEVMALTERINILEQAVATLMEQPEQPTEDVVEEMAKKDEMIEKLSKQLEEQPAVQPIALEKESKSTEKQPNSYYEYMSARVAQQRKEKYGLEY